MKIKKGFLICLLFILIFPLNVKAYTKKVLIIEINPMLETKGQAVSDFLGQANNFNTFYNTLPNDIREMSNGSVNVQIVKKEKLNEFPTYTVPLTRKNGTTAYSFDEETYLEVFGNGEWYGWWERASQDFKKYDGNFSFDYDYLINKFDLVNRRNRNEFNEVWVIGINPLAMYETAMVGRTAVWVNGKAIYKNCDNFIMAGFTISRHDTAIECLGHASEGFLSLVFNNQSSISYAKNNLSIDKTNYDSLNLWQKFTLTTWTNSKNEPNLTGPGLVHFAPNSTSDYDWLNPTYIESSALDWKNYPNLTGKTTSINYKTWNPSGDAGNAGRYFHKWWFSLMPHVSGRSKDGYSNNWWDYLFNLDYIKDFNLTSTNFSINSEVNLKYSTSNFSNKSSTVTINENYDNITYDSNYITVKNGKLYAIKEGTTSIKSCFDGKCKTNNITITNPPLEKIEITWCDNITEGENCTPTITYTPSNHQNGVITYTSSDTKIATFTDGKINALKPGNSTLTVSVDGKSATLNVTINKKSEIESVNISGCDKITMGESCNLEVNVLPTNYKAKSVSYVSSNNDIATITNGKVTGLKDGKVDITVIVDSFKKTYQIEVKKKPVLLTKIEIEGCEIISETCTPNIILTPVDTTEIPNYKSSDDSIAQFINGEIIPISNGEVEISVETDNIKTSKTITVEIPEKVIDFITILNNKIFIISIGIIILIIIFFIIKAIVKSLKNKNNNANNDAIPTNSEINNTIPISNVNNDINKEINNNINNTTTPITSPKEQTNGKCKLKIVTINNSIQNEKIYDVILNNKYIIDIQKTPYMENGIMLEKEVEILSFEILEVYDNAIKIHTYQNFVNPSNTKSSNDNDFMILENRELTLASNNSNSSYIFTLIK